jgi:hypothetical protein
MRFAPSPQFPFILVRDFEKSAPQRFCELALADACSARPRGSLVYGCAIALALCSARLPLVEWAVITTSPAPFTTATDVLTVAQTRSR